MIIIYTIIKQDILTTKSDIIVNASNSIGYMGGIISKNFKCKGVSESMNYRTNGLIEKAAKKQSRKYKHIPSFISSYNVGDIFVTPAYTLNSKFVIHAITMKYPGMKSNLNTIRLLLPKILNKTLDLNCKSIVIPLLGCGTGGLSSKDVLQIYNSFLKDIKNINITIVYI